MTGGEKLRAWRKDRELTAVEFATQLGITQGTVSKIETGQHRPDWKTLDAIVALTNGEVAPNDFTDIPEAAE